MNVYFSFVLFMVYIPEYKQHKTLIVLSGHEHWTDSLGTSDPVKSQKLVFGIVK